jgi:drug/metabolite transporter (DMT)-like permease
MTQRQLGFTLAIVAAVCFSGKAILAKLSYAAMPQMTPSLLLLLRMLFAVPPYLLLWYLNYKKHRKPVLLHDFVMAAGLGILGFYVSVYLDFIGLAHISAGLERVIVFTYPIWVLLLSVYWLKKRITPIQWFAQGLAWLGLIICFWGEFAQSETASSTLWWATLAVLASSVTFAIYLINAAPYMERIGTIPFICIAQITAGLAIFIHTSFDGSAGLITSIPNSVWGYAAIMGIVATFFPNIFNTAAVNKIGAPNMAIVNGVNPVVTIFLEFSILQKAISWQDIVGTSIVITGLYLLLRNQS